MAIDPTLQPDVKALETLLTRKRNAGSMLLDQDMWERWGAQHASDDERAARNASAAAADEEHRACVEALERAVAGLRTTNPAVVAAWADAHDELLRGFIARNEVEAKANSSSMAATGVFVAGQEREGWSKVKRAELAFVDQNFFYISIDAADYARIFGFELVR